VDVVFRVTELQRARRRVKAVRAARRGSELEGSRSTNGTRADQVAYARGSITAAELRDRVQRRYNAK
jgi:Antitoxin VbhA